MLGTGAAAVGAAAAGAPADAPSRTCPAPVGPSPSAAARVADGTTGMVRAAVNGSVPCRLPCCCPCCRYCIADDMGEVEGLPAEEVSLPGGPALGRGTAGARRPALPSTLASGLEHCCEPATGGKPSTEVAIPAKARSMSVALWRGPPCTKQLPSSLRSMGPARSFPAGRQSRAAGVA